jgi:TolB-like protein/DNA-binding winged helix-turn-helix (wHTH) protein/tetratricopeptide (TPR) repeat protein
MDAPPVRLTFDGWTLDRSTGDLSRGAYSTRLQIQPLQVLLELVDHAGELVTREALIARLWPTGVVEFDASLNTAVRKIRIALHDDPENPRYVETVPRRGYRFLAEVERAAPVPAVPAVAAPVAASASPPRRRRRAWYLALVIGLLAATAVVAWFQVQYQSRNRMASVVVLPFVDTGTEKKDHELAFAITEGLSNSLAQLDNIQVVSRTSAFGFEGRSIDVREIGRTLGVTHAIEGSLRRDQDVIRVIVQLVSTEDGYHLHSQSFDFRPETQVDIERALAHAVARPVRMWLSPEFMRRWQTRNTEGGRAIYFYARARDYARQHTPDGDDQAAALYRLAIERDPGFALAHIGLAETLLGSISARERRVSEVAPEVTRLLATAEKLGPKLPELLAAKGWLAMEQGDLVAASAHLRAALALDPGDAVSHGRLGNVYDLLGQPRDALESFTRAAELDPTDFIPQLYRCIDLQELGRYDEAERACARTRELQSDSHWGPFVTSWLETGRGNLPEAIRWTEEASRLAPAQAAVANYRIELLLSLRLAEQAREAARRIATTDEARMQLILASLALSEGGRDGLRAHLARAGTLDLTDMNALVEVMRLHHIAGDLPSASAVLDQVFALPGFNPRELANPEQVRNGFSAAVICAGVLIETGRRERALEMLADLDRLLDRLERNGWASHGLDSLRAESAALQGRPEDAMQALRRAVARGWRGAWRAQMDPSMASLAGREDFAALIRDVEARNASMRARFLELSRPRS